MWRWAASSGSIGSTPWSELQRAGLTPGLAGAGLGDTDSAAGSSHLDRTLHVGQSHRPAERE